MPRFCLIMVLAGMLTAVCRAGEPEIKVGFHGYAAISTFVDTRASATARNKHIYLYPLNEALNNQGEDVNRRSSWQLDAAHSRFGLDISGFEFKGVQATAMIEGDFLGKGSGDSNLRLRHAFVRFTRERWSLLVGQTWHPLFIAENCPGTVGSNAGAPFHPLNRSPQIQLSWAASHTTRLLLFVIEQNNFRNPGFPAGSEESMLPEVDFQARWQKNNTWMAVTVGTKSLAIPTGIEASGKPAKVRSHHMNASFRYRWPSFSVKMEGIYGGNLTEMVMPGGVGITSGNEYKPLQTASLWMGLQSNRTEGLQPGLFAGWLSNRGAAGQVTVVEELSRDPKVAAIYALSPRLKYIFGKVWAGAEWLWTTAQWGSTFDAYGVPQNRHSFENHRFLLSLRYNF